MFKLKRGAFVVFNESYWWSSRLEFRSMYPNFPREIVRLEFFAGQEVAWLSGGGLVVDTPNLIEVSDV